VLKKGTAIPQNFCTQDLILRQAKGKLQQMNRFSWQVISTISRHKFLTFENKLQQNHKI
jgi:hypothetical protein